MKTFKYIWKTSHQKICNVRFGSFVIVFMILSWTYDQPYLQFVLEKNYPISWCIFPFYMTSYSILLCFYLGIMYIHSDAPFMQHINMYQVVRTGRRRWAVGQIVGISVRSFTAVALAAISAVLPFTGNIDFSTGWGKVIKTIASKRGIEKVGVGTGATLEFRFFYETLDKYSPIQLMLLTIAICTLICTFLGVMMFLISLYSNKIFAVAGALMSVAALFIVENMGAKGKLIAAHFVPTYWAEIALSETITHGRYRLPSLTYIFTFLCISIAIMSIIIYWKIKHVEFNWENEDV